MVPTATTLRVPSCVDAREVEATDEFIAAVDRCNPCSLPAFHPGCCLDDPPVRPKIQVEACLAAAGRRLRRVNVGNARRLRLAG